MAAPKISVAMSTYNGGRYLEEQLSSLANQDTLPYELIVSDDASTDNTLAILQEFKKSSPFPVRIYNSPRNIGFDESFFKAAKFCTGDWVSFCDQDDFWLKNKISDCLNVIESRSDILIVLQNSFLTDSALNVTGKIFPDFIKPGLYQANRLYSFWVWPGFLQTVRSDLFNEEIISCRPKSYFPGHDRQPHDKWTCMMGNAIGNIYVIREPAAYYRRHDDALTGDFKSQKLMDRVGKSLEVSASHYEFLSNIAMQSANYLRRSIPTTLDWKWKSMLLKSAKNFDKVSDIQALRCKLYCNEPTIARLYYFRKILFSGGYLGPKAIAMGPLSGLKDLAIALGLISFRNS